MSSALEARPVESWCWISVAREGQRGWEMVLERENDVICEIKIMTQDSQPIIVESSMGMWAR